MKSYLKKNIKKDSIFYSVLSYLYYLPSNYWQPEKYFDLHELIKRYSNYQREVCFIQVGANDGISNDPLHQFILSCEWKGICVEPVPSNFEKLINTYSAYPNIHLLQAAIGAEGKQKIYFINPQKAETVNIQLPAWYNQLASFDKELVVSDIKGERKNDIVDFVEVQSLSFESLIKEMRILDLHLLHIDTEGADWIILKSFPFHLMKPDIILFEHNHLSLTDYRSAISQLKKLNYCFFKVETDTFCYQKKIKKLYGKL